MKNIVLAVAATASLIVTMGSLVQAMPNTPISRPHRMCTHYHYNYTFIKGHYSKYCDQWAVTRD